MSTKRKLSAKLGQPMLKQSAKVLSRSSIDESKAVISNSGHATKTKTNGVSAVVDISSDSSSPEDGEDDDGQEELSESEAAEEQEEPETESPAEPADVSMDDAAAADKEEEEPLEPSFGELVRANASEPIDVAGAFDDEPSSAATRSAVQIQAPSGASLGTVLSQALRTNDVSLLESCLHTTDLGTIRATIQRLDSGLAGTLLQKLASGCTGGRGGRAA